MAAATQWVAESAEKMARLGAVGLKAGLGSALAGDIKAAPSAVDFEQAQGTVAALIICGSLFPAEIFRFTAPLAARAAARFQLETCQTVQAVPCGSPVRRSPFLHDEGMDLRRRVAQAVDEALPLFDFPGGGWLWLAVTRHVGDQKPHRQVRTAAAADRPVERCHPRRG